MRTSAYTVAELAEHWSCTKHVIYEMIRSGQLHSFQLNGKLLRITSEEVEKYEKG